MKTFIFFFITILFISCEREETYTQLRLENGYTISMPEYDLCLVHADLVNFGNGIATNIEVKFTVKNNWDEYVYQDTLTDSIMPVQTKTLEHVFKIKNININRLSGNVTILDWQTK